MVKDWVEWNSDRETEVLGQYLPQCHYVDHKSHMTKSRSQLWDAGD
jgi:hypothetical protein